MSARIQIEGYLTASLAQTCPKEIAVPFPRAYGMRNMIPTILYGAADSINIEATLVYIKALSRPSARETALPSLMSLITIAKVTKILKAMVMV